MRGGVAVTGACQDRAGIVTRVPSVIAGCGSCPWRRKATLSAPFPQQQEAPPHPAQPESHQVPGSPCWLYQAAPRAGIACGCATGFTRKPRPSGVPSCPHPTHGRSLVPRRSGEPDCRGGILVPCPPVSPFPLHPRASAWGGTLRPPHTQGLCCQPETQPSRSDAAKRRQVVASGQHPGSQQGSLEAPLGLVPGE